MRPETAMSRIAPSARPNDAEGGKYEDLPALQAHTFGIIEERGEFLVNRDHGQQLRQTGATAPDCSLVFRCRDGPPQERRACQPEPKYPGKNDERIGADAVTCHCAKRGL